MAYLGIHFCCRKGVTYSQVHTVTARFCVGKCESRPTPHRGGVPLRNCPVYNFASPTPLRRVQAYVCT